jgi:hypothetical protein
MMGDHAELALAEEFACWPYDKESLENVWIKRRMSKTYWHCKDGRRLKIDDMELEHVRRCVAMMERQCQQYTNAYKVMSKRLSSPQ